MEIDIIDNNKYLSRSFKRELLSTAKIIAEYLDLPNNTELCISMVNDAEMRELNRNYRNIDRTTDILSFGQESAQFVHLLGDLVISYETTERHSVKYGVTLEYEFKKLLVHGILHLLGHDHKKKKEKEIMREMETDILNALSKNQ